MKTILPEFKHAKVMVIGDIMLDRYWYGMTNRISPEAPVPVVKVSSVEERPGGAANVAMNIALLGANSCIIGLTGMDDIAVTLHRTLTNFNVKCDFVSVPNRSTITKLRVFSRNQQLIRLDFEGEFKNIDPHPLYERISQTLENVGVLVLSDYAKGTLDNVQQMIALSRKSGVPVLVDPKGANFNRYRGATLLTPNLLEFEAVVGKCRNDREIINRGMKLISDLKLLALLITRSEQGMTLLQSDKTALHIPAQAREVYDVSGAGDTVISVLAATLAAGSTLEEACYVANIAAGVVVGKLGISTISPTELENAMRSYSKVNLGIMTEEELKIAVITARKRGEKVVMTNGIFDILHAGHVIYLANARKFGDRLIVAVNSDMSAKRLKGEMRPINSLEQRMIVLSALESVDWVVSFEENTPQRLIADILPDVLIKGGDYKPEQIAGGREVLANGGKVMALNFEDGCSTTNVIRKLQTAGNKQ